MANVAHSTLTGSNLHENKGVATASANQVATADGAGNTVWKVLSAANVAGTANPFGAQLFHIRDERSNGSAGQVYTNGQWATQVLQTVKTNEIAGASVFANQITLPTGTYRIEASSRVSCAGQGSNMHTTSRFRNISAGTTTIVGMGAVVATTANCQFTSCNQLFGTFTIAGSTLFEFQQYFSGGNANNSGISSGEVEVFADVLIWKIA